MKMYLMWKSKKLKQTKAEERNPSKKKMAMKEKGNMN